jgi:hypothetical protein
MFLAHCSLACFYTSRMPCIQNDRQTPRIAKRANPTLRTQLIIVSLAFCLACPLPLHAGQVRGADEDFPVIHNETITIRILDGVDGHPIPHAHLSLLAGYTQRDLHLEMWRQEALTDDHGRARLPNALASFPLLQISVDKNPTCEAHAGSATFSVDLIRRDGVSTPNRCGTAISEDAPGVFTVFVKTKPPKPLKPSKSSETPDVRKSTPSPTSIAPAPTAPAVAAPTPALTPPPALPDQTPADPAPAEPGHLRALAADRFSAIA